MSDSKNKLGLKKSSSSSTSKSSSSSGTSPTPKTKVDKIKSNNNTSSSARPQSPNNKPAILSPISPSVQEQLERKLSATNNNNSGPEISPRTDDPWANAAANNTNNNNMNNNNNNSNFLPNQSTLNRGLSQNSMEQIAREVAQAAVTNWLNIHGMTAIHSWMDLHAEKIIQNSVNTIQNNKKRKQELTSDSLETSSDNNSPILTHHYSDSDAMTDDNTLHSTSFSATQPMSTGRVKQLSSSHSSSESLPNRLVRNTSANSGYSPTLLQGDNSGDDPEVDPRNLVRQRMLIDSSQSPVLNSLNSSPGSSNSSSSKGPVSNVKNTGIIEQGTLQYGSHATTSPPAGIAGSDLVPKATTGLTNSRAVKKTSSMAPDILLVEDVKVSQKLAHTALTRAHYKVEVASDGETAVELYRANHGSLKVILMDIGLPGMNGIEATQRIRKLEQEVKASPVLIYGLTGNVGEDNLENYQACGMNGCIVKGKLLVDALKEALELSDRDPSEFVNLAGDRSKTKGFNSANSSQTTSPGKTPNNTQILDSYSNTNNTIPDNSKMKSSAPVTVSGYIPAPNINWPYIPGSTNPDVLLVEDVRVSQRLTKAQLEQKNGFKVEVASTGTEAIAKYKTHASTLRIILMDIGLPDISGIDAAETIRKLEKELNLGPILIFGLTGNVEEENLREYEQVGMNGCIVKGKQIGSVLIQTIEQAIKHSGVFINLVGQGDKVAIGVGGNESSNNNPGNNNNNSPVPMDSDSDGSTISQSSANSSKIDRVAMIRQQAANNNPATQDGAIGTPRAFQPRQLLQQKHAGAGSVKPGIGLPSAGRGSNNNTGSDNPSPPLMNISRTSGCDLLLVEDVKVSQKLASTSLTKNHWRVEVASDGEEAIRKFKQHYNSLRVILMDVGLPGKSGVDATIEIREEENKLLSNGSLNRPIQIFGLTGNVDEENLKLYEHAGMNGCIVKGTLLVDALQEALDKSAENPGQFVNLSSWKS